MAKTAVLHARVDSELKENVEMILSQLGLTGSDAVNLLYRQIALNGGLPFELKVPDRIYSERKLRSELQKGEDSALQSGFLSLEESKRNLGL